jgi:zinc D-Ala-D-Ala carboxypeptidase
MNYDISNHISYAEAIYSQTAIKNGIDNTPNQTELLAMRTVAAQVFEPLRHGIGDKPIAIDSFFRCAQLNNLIGGSSTTSQHMKGEAIDIRGLGNITNKQLFDYIKTNLVFDQLIWEYGNGQQPDWVHVSYSSTHNRKEVLRSTMNNGQIVWTKNE